MSLSSKWACVLGTMKGRNMLSIGDLTAVELRGVIDRSIELKQAVKNGENKNYRPLQGNSVAMIFEKLSTRTRVSSEAGTAMLGGHPIFMSQRDIQLGTNETFKDTAKVLSRFNSVIMARVNAHSSVAELAKEAEVPVINALCDMYHPLQTLADLTTLSEKWNGDFSGKTLTWVGDGNNVLHDLALGSAKLGMSVNVATPLGYEPDKCIMENVENEAQKHGQLLKMFVDPLEAVENAHVVVTDTWISMGQEDEAKKRMEDFAGYQVNNSMMGCADSDVVFLHCLPRHQEEVHDEVFYSPQSLVFDEAENRMWTVMAVILSVLGK